MMQSVSRLLEQADRTFQEALQTLALEHTVAQQGDIDELVHTALASGLGLDDVLFLLAQLA